MNSDTLFLALLRCDAMFQRQSTATENSMLISLFSTTKTHHPFHKQFSAKLRTSGAKADAEATRAKQIADFILDRIGS